MGTLTLCELTFERNDSLLSLLGQYALNTDFIVFTCCVSADVKWQQNLNWDHRDSKKSEILFRNSCFNQLEVSY